ncbi:MAG TPA: DUF1905 domain-containing protein [Planctomycetota bacterium]|nr:DUF1905 domain-containing protein [Planctomycetota bacterium]
MTRTKTERFRAPVHPGHKGPAIVVPFDPDAVWGDRPRQFVAGTLNGCAFEGEIGFRRRVFYTLLDDRLLRAAKLAAGDVVEVVMTPREAGEAERARKLRLAWSRPAGEEMLRPAEEERAVARNWLASRATARKPRRR